MLKLMYIVPYSGGGYNLRPKQDPWYKETIKGLAKKGLLKDVQIDTSEGYPLGHDGEERDEGYFVQVTYGTLKQIRAVSEQEKYDAIIGPAIGDFGFSAAPTVSKIPVVYPLHSAVHLASMIGDRCSIITVSDPVCAFQRRLVNQYGLGHKVVSIRSINRSSTYMMVVTRNYLNAGRTKNAEIKKVVGDVVAQCVAAVEKERADTIVIGGVFFQVLEDDIRKTFDKAGYREIPFVWMLPAAVEMAKALVNLKLDRSAVPYPKDALKVKPEFR